MRDNIRAFTALALAVGILSGCSTAPVPEDPEERAEYEQTNDPYEPTNRDIFEFNQMLDRSLIKPAAEGYRAAMPPWGRDRVDDFLSNMNAPVIFMNDVLQGEGGRAAETAGRFLMNSTFGVLGMVDVAKHAGIQKHSEDFGQTMAVWGVPEGPYIMLPLLGPTSPRDGIGMGVDMVADPIGWYAPTWANITRTVVSGVNTREQYLDILDEVERSSLDYYASIRSMYRQNRVKEIKNQ
jgi:phospholipid-binding lipoprotein MlaA